MPSPLLLLAAAAAAWQAHAPPAHPRCAARARVPALVAQPPSIAASEPSDAPQPSLASLLNGELTKAQDAEEVLRLTSKVVVDLVEIDPHHAVNVATSLHRLAVINKRQRAGRDAMLRDSRFALLVEATARHAGDLSARGVADVLWSFATLQHWPPVVLKPLLTRLSEQLEADAFEAQHLSTIVWALAKLECKPTRLLERIEAQAPTRLDAMNPQNFANLLWGFAKLKYQPTTLMPQLLEAICAPGVLEQAKPVEVADLSFAIGMLGGAPRQYDQLLLALAARASSEGVLTRFTSRQLVILIWAVAKLDAAAILPEGRLDEWVKSVRVAHQLNPLLASDARNLERALNVLGVDASWVSRSAILLNWQDAASGLRRRSKREYSEEELRIVFEAIDTDASGDIDLSELTIAIKQIRDDADEATIKKMMSFADEDGDLEVSFEEFKKIMAMM